MITVVPKNELNRIKEKRFDEILPQYLENFERGYYEEGDEGEVPICSKGWIPAAQTEIVIKHQAIFASGNYRIVTVPFGNVRFQERASKRSHFPVEPTGEQMICIAYPASIFERVMPAAFPASLWLNEALDFERNGRRDRALDIIFGETDKLFRRGEFDVCNRLLEWLDVEQLSVNILVAFLTITLPASEWLSARSNFYERVEKRLANHPNKAKLLSGLRGPIHAPRFY